MDNKDPQLPVEVACTDCGYVHLDECPQPPDLVEYARALVVAAFGCTAAFTMWRLVEMNFQLIQAGLPPIIDANIMLESVTFACGTVMGWAFSKRKRDSDD